MIRLRSGLWRISGELLLSRPRLAAGLVVGAALTWAVYVLANYYLQLWLLLSGGVWELPRLYVPLSLPFFGEAAKRALVGIGGAGLLVLSAAVLGLFAGRLAGWRYANPGESIVVSTSLGIGAFATLGLGLAALGWYRSWVLQILVGFTLAGGLLWLVDAYRKRRYQASFPPVFKANEIRTSIGRQTWQWRSVVAVAAALAFIAALAPEREYDALWYHLYYPRLFLEQGRLVDIPSDYVSLYPMTWELWFGYGLSLGGQTAATLLHFACLALTALLVYQLTRRYVPGAPAWLAVALFVTIPTVMWEASTAYIDLALSFHITLAFYAMLRYLEGRQLQWLMICGINLGLALASKHLALVALGLVGFGLLFGLWLDERCLRRVLWPAVLLGLISLLPALPWYARSYTAAGNPFFPELYAFFGAPPERWDAVTQQGLQQFLDHFGRPRTLPNLIGLPWHMTVHAANYDGALGPLFLVLLPFLVFARWKSFAGRNTSWLLVFSFLYIAVWASPLASFQMRFLVPVMPLLGVLAAEAYYRLSVFARLALRRRGAIALSLVVWLLLWLNLPPFTSLHERDRVEWDGWLNSVLHGVEWKVVVGAESQQNYLTRTIRSYPVWSYVNRHLPAEARVLTWTGGDQFYTYHDRIWAYSAVARLVSRAQAGDTDDLVHALNRLGVTHLIADNDFKAYLERLPGPAFDVLHEDRFYTLYGVP